MCPIEWVGTIALGVLQDGKPCLRSLVEEGQGIPAEFNVGDEVLIENHPADPASIALGMDCGYCEVKHAVSGTAIQIMRRVYEYMYR